MEKWGFNLKARNNFQNHTVDMFWSGGLCYCQHCVLLSFTTTYTCSSMQKILILAPFSLKSPGLYLHETEMAIRVLFFFPMPRISSQQTTSNSSPVKRTDWGNPFHNSESLKQKKMGKYFWHFLKDREMYALFSSKIYNVQRGLS